MSMHVIIDHIPFISLPSSALNTTGHTPLFQVPCQPIIILMSGTGSSKPNKQNRYLGYA